MTQGTSTGIVARLWRLYSGLSPSSTSNIQTTPTASCDNDTGPYYGVYLPPDSTMPSDQEILHVYKDKSDALAMVKKYKKARFKAANTRQEAVAFALRGTDQISDRSASVLNGKSVSDGGSMGSPTVGEKPSLFKQPKPQEMIQLRKAIEAGDMELVRKTVWENPRFLVSSGDTPAILQEGSRYNALHVGVKAMNVEMCDFVLSTIADVQFIQLLYSEENLESAKVRASILLDLYLNMPDKAMNETPLHFASKFGAKDIVELLVSFPQCSRTATNKYGEQPKDIICQRAKEVYKVNADDIAVLLKNTFYVPVLHSEDSTSQPIIGEPFLPGSPPVINANPMNPRMEIRAFAGPMDQEEAITFRKKWKTPPRVVKNQFCLAEPKFRLRDMDKGLETIGRDLAQKCKVGWKEYWPFLDTFTDFSTDEGLNLLENYLKNKYTIHWSSSNNSLNLSDSCQPSPRTPADEQPFNFSEKVSNSSKNMSSRPDLSPITDLCLAFNACTLNDNSNNCENQPKPKRIPEPKKVVINPEDEAFVQNMLNPGLCPYLCVEKACDVFAKRIILGLRLTPSPDKDLIVKCLKNEAKRLQQTVASYMDDPRFYCVDFHLIHSRLAQLIAQKLKSDNSFADDIEDFSVVLKEISSTADKNCDIFSSDDDDTYICKSSPKESKDQYNKKRKGISVQIKCLATNILRWLADWKSDIPANNICSEEECIDIWADLFKCYCPWQTEQFYRNCRKNASLKRTQIKNRDGSNLSSSPKLGTEYISRRLRFDSEEDPPENDNKVNAVPVTNNIPSLNECDEKKEESSSSGDEEEKFYTPVSSRSGSPTSVASVESDYEELDNKSVARDVFIQGDKPTKMDSAVFNAIKNYQINMEKYPNIYRWRHSIGLYPQSERDGWPLSSSDNECLDDIDTPITCSFNIGHISNFGTSTPTRKITNLYSFSNDANGTKGAIFDLTSPKSLRFIVNSASSSMDTVTPPMQVSKWLRITGPNSPRSAFINKNMRPNVSFEF